MWGWGKSNEPKEEPKTIRLSNFDLWLTSPLGFGIPNVLGRLAVETTFSATSYVVRGTANSLYNVGSAAVGMVVGESTTEQTSELGNTVPLTSVKVEEEEVKEEKKEKNANLVAVKKEPITDEDSQSESNEHEINEEMQRQINAALDAGEEVDINELLAKRPKAIVQSVVKVGREAPSGNKRKRGSGSVEEEVIDGATRPTKRSRK